MECLLDVWDPQDPKSDFLDNWCRLCCFDIDNVYVAILEGCGRKLITFDHGLVRRAFLLFVRLIFNLRKVEDEIDNVLVMTFLGVVGDFSESRRGTSRETCHMVYVPVHDELS